MLWLPTQLGVTRVILSRTNLVHFSPFISHTTKGFEGHLDYALGGVHHLPPRVGCHLEPHRLLQVSRERNLAYPEQGTRYLGAFVGL